MEFITQSAVKIYYEFLHLRSFICLGMQKNMDIAELNNKIGYILSFPSAVSQPIKTKAMATRTRTRGGRRSSAA